MALLLAVTTVISSVPTTAFASDTSEYATEVATEGATEKVTEKSTEAATEAKTQSETVPETAAEETKVTEAVESTEYTENTETTVTETEKATESEKTTEVATEAPTESESGKPVETEASTEEKVTEAATEATTEGATEAETESVTEDSSETEVHKGTLKIKVSEGGKVILKDKNNNVIKEVVFVSTEEKPYELKEEEGTVVRVEVVPDGEGYEVGTYRLTLDSGEVKEEVTSFDEGIEKFNRDVVLEKDIVKNIEVSFNKVVEESESETEVASEVETETEAEIESEVSSTSMLEVSVTEGGVVSILDENGALLEDVFYNEGYDEPYVLEDFSGKLLNIDVSAYNGYTVGTYKLSRVAEEGTEVISDIVAPENTLDLLGNQITFEESDKYLLEVSFLEGTKELSEVEKYLESLGIDFASADASAFTESLKVLVNDDTFDANTNYTNFEEFISDTSEVKCIRNDVDITKEGVYPTVYEINTEGHLTLVVRQVEVVSSLEDSSKLFRLNLTTDGFSSVLSDKIEYREGEEVSFSVISPEGVTLNSVSVKSVDETGMPVGEELEVKEISGEGIFGERSLNDVTFSDVSPEGENSGSEENVSVSEYKFIMPDTDVTVVPASTFSASASVFAVNPGLDNVKLTESTKVHSVPKSWANTAGHGGVNYASTRERKITYVNDEGESVTTLAFCIQPKENSPGNGEYSVVELGDGNKVAKGLFYLYNGPAWKTDANIRYFDSSENKWKNFNLKKYLKNNGVDVTNESQCYAISHYILSYLYGMRGDDLNSNSEFRNVLSTKGLNCVTHIGDIIASSEKPETKFSATTVSSTYANGVATSETITYTSFTGNDAHFSVPAGVTVYSGGNTYGAGSTAEVKANTSFYLVINPTEAGIKPGQTAKVTVSLEMPYKDDFTAYKIKIANEKQDIAFAYNFGSRRQDISVSVTVPGYGSIAIEKHDTNTGTTASSTGYSMDGALYGVYDLGGTLVTTITIKNGRGTASNLKPGTYKVKETNPPEGYSQDPNTYTVNVPVNDVITVYSEDTPNPTPLSLKKVSSNPSITDGNAMYSLANAKYGVYTNASCSGNPIQTLVTDEKGVSNTVNLLRGDYWVKEISAPKGYMINSKIYPVTLSKNSFVLNVSDEPLTTDVSFKIEKVGIGTTDKPMNAEFTIKYFDNPNHSGSPKRTWVMIAKGNGTGEVQLNESFSKPGVANNFYKRSDGKVVLPLGSISIEETKAPEGFQLDGRIQYGSMTQNGNSVSLSPSPEAFGAFRSEDAAYFGSVSIKKIDSESNTGTSTGDGTLEGAVYAVINNGSNTIYRPDNPEKGINPGGEVCRITTDKTGYAETPEVYSDADSEYIGVLQANNSYIIREVDPSTGYLIPTEQGGYQKEFFINDKGDSVDLTNDPFEEPIIRGSFKLRKYDKELMKPNQVQGDATLKGMEVSLTNMSENPVYVDTDGDGVKEEFAVGAEIARFTSNEEGLIEAPANYLPYGTYKIRETVPPEGYTPDLSNEKTFEIRENGKVVDLTSETEGFSNRVIRFDIELIKFKDDLEGVGSIGKDVPLPDVTFEIYHGDVRGNTEGLTPVCSIVTDKDGVATTASKDYPYGRLPYGTYTLHEAKHPEEVLPVEDFIVTGDEDGKVYKGIYKSDKPIEQPVTIVKVDSESGKPVLVKGTRVQILDENKKPVEFTIRYPHVQKVTEFVTDESGYITLPEKLPYGSYFIHEVKAPEGYLWDEDTPFKVSQWTDWGSPLEVKYDNAPAKGKLRIEKYDEDTNDLISGAEFSVYADDDIVTGDDTVHYTKGDLVDTIVIDDSGKGTSKALYLGKYMFKETARPDGFALDRKEYKFELTYKDQTTEFVYHDSKNYNKPTTLRLHKYDIDGVDLDGVTFRVERLRDYASDRSVNNPTIVSGGDFTTSNGGNIVAKYWESGVYKIYEVATLPGYVLDDTVRYFTVTDEGYIYECDEQGTNLGSGESDELSLEWENDYTKWDFTKVDATGGDEIEGAEMEILNADGDVVYSWTSTDKPHRIVKIPLGKYTLVEKTAPEGYVRATSVPFEVTNTGVVQKLTMVDKILSVVKKDQNGDSVIGAKMAVYAYNNGATDTNALDTWTTSNEPHRVSNLDAGKTYVLVETEAPEGWVLANPVVFTILDDKKDQEVSMTDIRVKAHKFDETKNQYVEGATLEVRDREDKVVDTWVTTKEFHYISGLIAGHSYTLYEIDAPEGFAVALPVKFTVDDNGKDQEVTMINKKVIVSKVDTNVIELAGAELEVRDADDKVVDKWVSDGKPHAIDGLEVGKTYTLYETKAPEGYAIATPITFTVADNAKNDEFNLVNKRVLVHKTDVFGSKEIPGAKLQVLDLNGNVVDEWISTEEPHPISNIVVGETYILHEEVAAEGYVVANDVEFTVTDDGIDQHVTMVDKRVFVSKKSVTGDDELPGAKLSVIDKEGNVVDTWVSTDEIHPISGLKVDNTYTLVEEIAPDGYVIANSIEFTVYDDFLIQEVNMVDKQVFLEKLSTDGNFVEGAEFEVTDKDGKVVDSWVSTNDKYAIKNLVIGNTYTLTETKAPEGWVLANPVEFTVEVNDEHQTIKVVDMRVKAHKFDESRKDYLEGSKLEVRDSEGKVVDSWTTGKDFHYISGLIAGHSYLLVEVEATPGYTIATPVPFKVDDDNTDKEVTMVNTQIFVSKVDTAVVQLAGAELEVRDKDGNVVDKWVSDGTPHAIKNLVVGETYTLYETKAPEGYVIALPITFTVADNAKNDEFNLMNKQVFANKTDLEGEMLVGATMAVYDKNGKEVDKWVTDGKSHAISGLKINETYILREVAAPNGYVIASDVEFTVTNDESNQTVVMKDKQFTVSKVDITTKEELPGATLTITDKETGEVVEGWVSTEEVHYVSGLTVNKTYILTETTAPDGYVRAEDIEFTVKDDFTIQGIVMEDDYTKVEISKTDITNGKELPGAKLQIKDSEGKVIEEWVSTNEPHMIEKLPVGDYTLIEITAPAGYEVAEEVKFTVEETGEIQHVEMKDAPTPPKKIPQTGENPWLFGGALVVVLLGGVSLVVMYRKKRKSVK